jgi:2',3'-cyclic-nucleotide 2'-phosphodiesterase (5'-nucleotidase family)
LKPEIDVNFLLLTDQKECLKRFDERGTKAVLPVNWFRNNPLSQSLYYINDCHSRTKYKLTVRNNKAQDVARVAAKIKILQKRRKPLH